MTKALPRRYRDLDAEARSAARAEARRSGKRLGAWLDEASRDDYYDDEDEDDRVEAVARRLARSGEPAEPRRRREEEREPRRWRDEAKGHGRRDRDDSRDQPHRRREDDDRPRRRPEEAEAPPRRWRDEAQRQRRRWDDRDEDQPPRWREDEDNSPRRRRDPDEDIPQARREPRFDHDEDREVERRDRAARRVRPAADWREADEPVDASEIVADAAAIVGRRIAQSERQTARALDNLAELVESGARNRESAEEGLAFLARRLGRIESRLAAQSSEGESVRPIRSALARLESRLERLSGSDRVAHVEEALDGLDRRLAEIARRLETPSPRGRASAPAPEPAAAAHPAPAPAPVPAPAPGPAAHPESTEAEAPRRAESFARRRIEESLAEIARRQRALDAVETQTAQPQPAPPASAPARPAAPGPNIPPAPPLPHMEAVDFAPPHRQIVDVQSRLDAISQQLEVARRDAAERADHHLVVMRQVEALRRDLVDMSSAIVELAPRASIGAIETALRELSRRIELQRGQGIAEELLAPAERIAGELRVAIKELDPAPLVRNLHADVQTIGRRLDALQQPGAVDPAAIELLVDQTRDIRSQLEGLAARPLPLEKIEARLVDLTQRVELLTRAGGGAAKAAVAFDMGEVARSIRAIVAEETSSSFDTFSGRLETLAAKLDGVVSEAGGKQRFDELGRRIDDLGHKLAKRIAANAAQTPTVDTSSLENLVSGLAKKLDKALDHKRQSPAIEEIGRKLDVLETRLPDPSRDFAEIGHRIGRIESRLPDSNAAESLARIEAALTKRPADFADLAQRIEGVRETLTQKFDQGRAAQTPGVGAIEKLVRGLDTKVDAALAAGATARDIAPILNQLEQLSLKVDRLDDPAANPKLGEFLKAPAAHPKLDEIVSRLDHMQMALARRADEGARVEARQAELTDLVGQLATQMNLAADQRGDVEALRALESQIGALSQRLDRTDHNSAALAQVEEKISALVAQIEDTKTATSLAAEEAVRRATQEILREASPDADALRNAIERELADLRSLQDESGQRTHETLLAVHETLERVVDRLAIFEEELSELRSAPPAAKPARRVEAARVRSPAPETPPPVLQKGPGVDPGDLLGSSPQPPRRPAIAEPAPAPERAAEAAQMDFIAAARRAAQQAARDAQAAERAHAARRAVPEGAETGAAGIAAKPTSLSALKRPLLLGLGALVLMVGAYQIARIGINGADEWRHDHQQAKLAPADEDERAAPADKSDARALKGEAASAPAEPGKGAQRPAGAPGPQSAPAPRMILPQGGNQPLDKSPVGSIGTGGLNPLATAPQQDAVAAIRALAEQGNPSAQFELAVRSADGRGVPRDPKVAAQWFEKAAAQGLAPAQYRLGSLYEKGVGVERDHARARKFYQAAAEAGNARAMHNLAVMLAEGGDGGKPDYAGASEWFRKAGEVGVRDSQFNLAILYARGLGVNQSLVQSYLWFSAAAAQGDADAEKKREEVAARLDSKELAAAKAAAAAFRVKEAPRAANEVAQPAGGWENVRMPSPLQKPATKPKVSVI